jgi:hypothetical protein
LVSISEEFFLFLVPAGHLTFAVSVGHAPDSNSFVTFLNALIKSFFGFFLFFVSFHFLILEIVNGLVEVLN